jgi:myo-inositol 2-dehydrogenase / D-chiro-inositol 1-dehydrogenase
MKTSNRTSGTSRREFIKTSSTAVAGAALGASLSSARPAYTAERNTIKIALIGCGGRGSGAAANALSTPGPTQLWAIADVFESRAGNSIRSLSERHGTQVAVPEERRFIGFGAYKQAIDSLDRGDVVILATPPAFRPLHLEYAVEKGVHVFMEKSFAVDAPGIRRVLRAGEVAEQKNLKIATGLMSRHYEPLEEAVSLIHSGAIGEPVVSWAYRMHGPVALTPRKAGESELAHQIANYSCFTWLNGSFLVDWLIHNIDVCCWIKNDWPVSVQGMGGRQTRQEPDQMYDHCGAEFTFADGTRMSAQGRHMAGCWGFFGVVVHGANGSAVLGEGQVRPRLFKGHNPLPQQLLWQAASTNHDPYQTEFDRLMRAIRNDEPWNETERSAKSCFTAIMGRMAVESGQRITYEEALASTEELAPGLEQISSLNNSAPVQANEQGRYPIAMPGGA